MNAQHTPGPWIVGMRYGNRMTEIDGPNGNAISTVWTHDDRGTPIDKKGRATFAPTEHGPANARLIAASPDLVALVERIMLDLNGRNATARATDSRYAASPLCQCITALVRDAAAALAKARGD